MSETPETPSETPETSSPDTDGSESGSSATDGSETSGLPGFGQPALGPERSGASAVLAMLVLLVLVLGAAYTWAVVNAGDDIAPGTRVAGVDVGGAPPAAAEVRLRNALATQASAEVDLTVGGMEISEPPGVLGLGLDYSASIEQAVTGSTWLPANLWRFYTGGERYDPVVTVDRPTFLPLVNRLVRGSERAPVEGSIVFRGASYQVVEPVEGTRLDRDAAVDTLRREWLTPGAIDLPLEAAVPDIDAGDVEQAVAEIAEPLVQGPVRLRVGDQVLRLASADYTDLVAVTPADGRLTLAVNQERLPLRVSLLLNQAGELADGSDAEIVVRDGLPEVVPSVRGQKVDVAPLVQRFREAVLAADTADRVLRVPIVSSRPALSTAQAEGYGITEEVAQVTIPFPAASFRDTNLARAAEELAGAVLAPDATLAFNEAVGPPTAPRGFVEGPLYDDGQAFVGAGAGLSRLATALTSAVWQAGLALEQRTAMPWHPEEYPIGVDASVQFGSFDLVVGNPSPYGVLVTAEAATDGDRSVTVTLWSTPWREVRTTLSAFTDQESPASEFVSTVPCVGVAGQPGFDVTASRTLVRPGNGRAVGTDELSTSYRPLPNIVCVSP